MRNIKRMLFLAAFLSILVSCVNTGKGEDATQLARPEKNAQKKEEKLLNIAGFGFARSTDKGMSETWARNNALASLAEQAWGTSFVYSPTRQELKLEAEADQTFTGLSAPVLHEVYQNGKYWNAFTVYNASAQVEIPADSKTEHVQMHMQTLDMQALVQESCKIAFQELTRQPLLQTSTLSGRVYLEEITILPVTAGKEYSVTASFFIVYKQD